MAKLLCREGEMSRAFAVAAAALVLAASPLARAEDTLKLAIGQKGAWTTSMVDWGMRQDFFKAEGLDPQVFYTDGGAPTLQAVISGSADMAIDTGLLGVIGAYAKGAPLRVISANTTGSDDTYWFVKADSGMKSIKDIAGKTIGYSQPGSSSNLETLALLDYFHVAAKPVAAGSITAGFTQFMTGQLDVGWAVPPIGLKELEEGKIIIIARGNDVPAIRDETVRVNLANKDVLEKRHDAIMRFMRAYERTIDWAYRSPEAIAYFAEANHVTEAIAKKSREEFFPRQMMQLYKIEGLDTALKQALDAKYISHPMIAADLAGLFQMVKPPAAK